MYERFYGISRNAFSLTPDPGFLVMTQAHCNAKAGLMYAILGAKGFTVLTGEAGTGKTTLLRSVIKSVPRDRLCFSLVTNPVLSPLEFAAAAITDFGLPKGASKSEDLRNLQEFLLKVHAEGKLAVLFVDEAHRLSVETLEEIRLLTNFETETRKLLQIVLAGQDELGGMLDLRELRQLKQRIEVRLEIGPLLPAEVQMYITRRWNCVATSESPFAPDAVRLIARVSGGIPRLINSVCDNALLIGFAQNSHVITAKHIAEVSRDLHLAPVPEVRTERYSRFVNGPAKEKAAGPFDLQIPPPVSTLNGEDPMPAMAKDLAKRSWWWPRRLRQQREGNPV